MQTRILFCLPLLVPGTLSAADFHLSPAGAGTKDGTSPANAAPAESASALFNDTLQAGDRLLLAAGEYKDLSLKLSQGGEKGKPKSIVGASGSVMVSGWTIEKPDKGATAITLEPGLSHVIFKDLSIRNYCYAVRANKDDAAPRIGLEFDNVDMEQMRHGYYLSDCDDLVIKDSDLKRYSKHGFRWEQGCDRVLVSRCTADCSEGDPVWETKTEVFPFGFNVNKGGAPNTGFVFEDCLATNNIKSNQKVRYSNGDGFVVEGNSADVSFIRCRAIRNQDAGYDLKPENIKLVDCVATGHRRDFRIWRDGTLTNCMAGWSQTGFWTKGGPVTLDHCTFIGHTKSCVEIEGKSPGPIIINNSLLVTGMAKFGAAIGKHEGTGTIAVKSGEEAGLAKADPSWDGTGTSLDSTNHADKGYSSKRISKDD